MKTGYKTEKKNEKREQQRNEAITYVRFLRGKYFNTFSRIYGPYVAAICTSKIMRKSSTNVVVDDEIIANAQLNQEMNRKKKKIKNKMGKKNYSKHEIVSHVGRICAHFAPIEEKPNAALV